MIKASIVLPVYNVEDYLEECLDSINNQTYKDFEVIIVDDGSTDGSSQIIKRYTEKYENMSSVRQENRGLAGARNTGLKYCKGEYVLFVDSDDYLDSSYVEKLINKAEDTDSDIVMCSHKRFYEEDVKGKDKIIKLSLDSTKEYSGVEVAELILRTKVPGYAWQRLFRRSNLIKNKLEFDEGKLIEDFYPIFKESYLSKKITFIDEPLYFYRQRATSITYSKGMLKLKDFKFATDKIINFAIQNNMDKSLIKYFKNYVFKEMIYMYYDVNKDSKSFYLNYRKEGYNQDEPSIFDIVFNKETTLNRKCLLLSWKFRVFKLALGIIEK